MMKCMTLLVLLIAAALPASAQTTFDLRFDHSTVLVTDLEKSSRFYEDILHLEPLDTPWGPTAPIRFFSLGSSGELHMGLSEAKIEPDRNIHLALAVKNFDAYLVFLRDRGITYSNFSGSRNAPQVRPDGVRQVYLQDPDGNWIEINDGV